MSTAVAFSSRMVWSNPDGTLSREAVTLLQALLNRTGGAVYDIPADSVTFSPTGGLTAQTVQQMGAELDAEKQPIDATLTALAALVTVADRLIYATGADAFALTTFTAFARTLLDDVDAATMRSTLGLGSIATQNANGVAITGGAIDNTPIGATTQNTGKFTTVQATSYVRSGSTVVGSLPSAATAGQGARMFVTDATSTTFLSTVSGGGANKVPVVSDGTNWLIG